MFNNVKVLLLVPLLISCTTLPSGPDVLVLQGEDKDYAQFQNDDKLCRNEAHQQLLKSPVEPSSLEKGQVDYDIVYIQCMYGNGHLIPAGEDAITAEDAFATEDALYGALQQDWDESQSSNEQSVQ